MKPEEVELKEVGLERVELGGIGLGREAFGGELGELETKAVGLEKALLELIELEAAELVLEDCSEKELGTVGLAAVLFKACANVPDVSWAGDFGGISI